MPVDGIHADGPRSGDAASETTAQVLLSMKILPSSFSREPILTPLAVMPRMYHSPSHSSLLAGGAHLFRQRAYTSARLRPAQVFALLRQTRASAQ